MTWPINKEIKLTPKATINKFNWVNGLKLLNSKYH